MNDNTNQQKQQYNALKHCQRIKSVYKQCRRKLPQNYSYTHIPVELWETIETMLNDDAIAEHPTNNKEK